MTAVNFHDLLAMQGRGWGNPAPSVPTPPREASTGARAGEGTSKRPAPPVTLVETWDMRADPTGWWASEKYDGVRAWWDGENLISRQGNVFGAPAWFKARLPRKGLDGELWLGPGRFAEVSGVARGGAPDDWRGVRFMAFDVPEHTGVLEARLVELHTEVQLACCPWLKAVEERPVQSATHLRDLLVEVEARGGEGLVLRRPGSLYAGVRSSDWQRLVSVQTAEAVVVGYTQGAGNRAGGIGALICRLPNGTQFKVGTGFKIADLMNPPPVGSTVTFGYKCLTVAGVPREPRFVRVRNEE